MRSNIMMKLKGLFLVFFLILGVVGCANQQIREVASKPEGSHLVVFMSDFGLLDDAVPICKGVMVDVDPAIRIIDSTHQVIPFSINDGAIYLANMAPYFPPGTAFVTVVDPGVGSERRSVVAKSKKGHYYVGPDNGLLTYVQDQYGIEEVREIKNTAWMRLGKLSNTFHGKDVYSPVGAHLAKGDPFEGVGPVYNSPLVRLKVKQVSVQQNKVEGQVIATDGPYGNLITNVMVKDVEALGFKVGDTIPVKVGNKSLKLPLARIFGDVGLGKSLFYFDWHDRLCLAVNQGNFSKQYQIQPGAKLEINKHK